MRWAAFRVGAIAWVFTGVVHDILEFVLQGDPELTAMMKASETEIGPLTLNADLLNRGVSLAMGLAMIIVGVLLWMIADTLREEPERARPYGIVALVGSVLTLALAAVLIPGPPLVTFAVATVAFAIALIRKTSEPRTASRDTSKAAAS